MKPFIAVGMEKYLAFFTIASIFCSYKDRIPLTTRLDKRSCNMAVKSMYIKLISRFFEILESASGVQLREQRHWTNQQSN